MTKDRRTLILLDVPGDASLSAVSQLISSAMESSKEERSDLKNDETYVGIFTGKDVADLLKANRRTVAASLVKKLCEVIGNPNKVGEREWINKFWFLYYKDPNKLISREVLTDISKASSADKEYFRKLGVPYIMDLAEQALHFNAF